MIGTYDSFHPFIPKGVGAEDIGLIYETLMTSSQDEPFTEYGLLAAHVQMPEDRSFVIFHLHPDAKFHDGVSVKPADVIFTFNSLLEKGDPFYKKYYKDVQSVTDLGEGRVRFDFGDSTNQELPLIVGHSRYFLSTIGRIETLESQLWNSLGKRSLPHCRVRSRQDDHL